VSEGGGHDAAFAVLVGPDDGLGADFVAYSFIGGGERGDLAAVALQVPEALVGDRERAKVRLCGGLRCLAEDGLDLGAAAQFRCLDATQSLRLPPWRVPTSQKRQRAFPLNVAERCGG